jgi:membrane dipeptidase
VGYGNWTELTPSPLGYELIKEMNRLGMLIDLSHVSDRTALQAM